MSATRFTLFAALTLPAFCIAQNVGIGTQTPLYPVHITSNVAQSGGTVLYSVNTGTMGNAVLAVSNNINTNAVQGTSNNGTGVLGYSNNFRGIAGSTISGVALYGSSITGYGLQVSGKIQISGGNTNPRQGTILTSDPSGNAVWKTPRIAFFAKGITADAIPKNVSSFRIQFITEEYDYGNNFTKAGDDPSPSNTSIFTAPVAGLYTFHLKVKIWDNSDGSLNDDTRWGNISLYLNRNGVVSEIASAGEDYTALGDIPWRGNDWYITREVKLQAGDKIYPGIYMKNDDADETVYMNGYEASSCFSGRLIWED